MENEPRNDLLQQARDQRGWTQLELAEKLAAAESSVRSWEHGTTPSAEYRKRLCKLFEMTPEELGIVPNRTKQPKAQTVSNASLESTPNSALPVAHDVPKMAEQDPNRRSMLKRVRSRWISDVLDHSSLDQGTFMHLRLREQPDAVVNPWAQAVQQTILTPKSLPVETRIRDVYDEADGSLLLLGEPGAGKTTSLLSLTRDLLEEASLDQTHPMPVVFHLASWAEKRAILSQWLVDELQVKYQVPRKLAQTWISENQILPLLDGLDEVALASRAYCVQAINAYRKEHGFVPMVVCCRASEYLALNTRIALDKAITIEPLVWEEIASYLSMSGMRGVELALKSDPGLREMASTPLMLQIIAQTFRVTSIQALLSVQDQAKRHALIFEKYIEIALKRRGQESQYSSEQTIHWLSRLAAHLKRQNQTEFYLERLQQDWLEDASRQTYRQTLFRIVYGIDSAAIAGLFAWLRGGRVGSISGVSTGLLGWLGAGPGNSVLGWMAPGMGGGLEGGGMLGTIFFLAAFLITIIIDSYSQTTIRNWSWKSIQKGMGGGLKNALISGGISAPAAFLLFLKASDGNLNDSLPRALGFGLFSAMQFGLITLLSTSLRQPENPPPERKWTGRLLDGICTGACAGLGFGVVTTMQAGLEASLLTTALISIAAVLFGMSGGLGFIEIGEIKTAESVAWSWQNVQQHMAEDIAKGATIGLSIAILVFFMLSLASGLFYGPYYGISYGLIYGLITGFIVGITSLLTTVLNRGWESSLLSEDQLVHPNEGIRRSLRHGIFAGFLFGPIGGLASGLVGGFAFGLIGKLPGWLVLAIGLSIVFTLILTLQFALIRGGIACIEHYILRWFLWRKTYVPLHYIQFLNYAAERIFLRRIGGGYMFRHRLLLEYFASLEPETK